MAGVALNAYLSASSCDKDRWPALPRSECLGCLSLSIHSPLCCHVARHCMPGSSSCLPGRSADIDWLTVPSVTGSRPTERQQVPLELSPGMAAILKRCCRGTPAALSIPRCHATQHQGHILRLRQSGDNDARISTQAWFPADQGMEPESVLLAQQAVVWFAFCRDAYCENKSQASCNP